MGATWLGFSGRSGKAASCPTKLSQKSALCNTRSVFVISQSRSVLPPPSTKDLTNARYKRCESSLGCWDGVGLLRVSLPPRRGVCSSGGCRRRWRASVCCPRLAPAWTPNPKSQIDHLAVIDGAAAEKWRWRRRPRQRQASDRRGGCGGEGLLVPGECEGPQLRSAALLGLALARRLLPLREPDLPEPARASAPPPAIPPSAPPAAAGRVSARTRARCTESQALPPSFPHAPPDRFPQTGARLAGSPPPFLWPPVARQPPPQPLHLLSIFQEFLTKPSKKI